MSTAVLAKQTVRGALTLVVIAVSFSIPFLPALTTTAQSYGMSTDRAAPDFSLFDAGGTQVSLQDYRGKFVFLMFGYLSCPDVCHSQALLFQEIDHLADMKNRVQFLYLAMDPARDSKAQLQMYFDGRGDNFTSLTADRMATMQALAADYHAYYSTDATLSSGDYEINHPGLYFLIDPQGQLRQRYSQSHNQARLVVADLKMLIRQRDNEDRIAKS